MSKLICPRYRIVRNASGDEKRLFVHDEIIIEEGQTIYRVVYGPGLPEGFEEESVPGRYLIAGDDYEWMRDDFIEDQEEQNDG